MCSLNPALFTGTSQLGDVRNTIQMLDNPCNGNHQRMAEQEELLGTNSIIEPSRASSLFREGFPIIPFFVALRVARLKSAAAIGIGHVYRHVRHVTSRLTSQHYTSASYYSSKPSEWHLSLIRSDSGRFRYQ